jgi:hypothetical protein
VDEHRARRWRVRARDVGVVASGLILISCGGGSSKGGSAQAGSTAATASLKRLEVEVIPGGSAALPTPTLLARLGALVLGGPRAAEAAPAIPNCAVSASTLPGVTVTTNAVGKAVLSNVPVPATVTVSCPDGTSGAFPVNGEAGALVTIRVRGRAGRLEVRSRHGAISPSISEPSVSQSGHGSGSSSSRRGSNSGSS